MKSSTAREIERLCEKTPGWLDQDHERMAALMKFDADAAQHRHSPPQVSPFLRTSIEGYEGGPAAQPVNVSRIAPPSLRQALDILGDAVKASPNKDLGGEIGVLLTAYVKNPDNKSLVDTIISLIDPGQANGGTAQVPPVESYRSV